MIMKLIFYDRVKNNNNNATLMICNSFIF